MAGNIGRETAWEGWNESPGRKRNLPREAARGGIIPRWEHECREMLPIGNRRADPALGTTVPNQTAPPAGFGLDFFAFCENT
jgi:hypothetical protein